MFLCLLKQKKQPDELIITDDGSSQKVLDFIGDLIPKAQFKVKHIYQEDKGFRKTRALNNGVRNSIGDLLIFCDQDLIFGEEYIETIAKNIKKAIENNIKVEVLPGANAFVPAIVGSGLNTAHFIFYGFLNHSKSKKKKELVKLLNNIYPIIFYESPHRITETLEIIKELYPNRKLSLSRELTKIHEEYIRGTAEEILNTLIPKGEFVLIVDSSNIIDSIDFKNMDINEHYNFYKSQGLEKKEIIKKISKDLNIHKSEIYKLFI